MNNPMQMLKMLINNNAKPKEVAMQMLCNTNNPVIINLVEMAKKGDTQGVENFARNYMKEQGKDFDKEMNEFMKNFK